MGRGNSKSIKSIASATARNRGSAISDGSSGGSGGSGVSDGAEPAEPVETPTEIPTAKTTPVKPEREPNQGLRRHKLLTQEIRDALPPLYSQEGKVFDAVAHVKFFNPYGNAPWYQFYATEFDGEDTFFGYCISNYGADCDEWCYVSYSEIAEASFQSGLTGRPVEIPAIERDTSFSPARVRDCENVSRSIWPDAAKDSAGTDADGSAGGDAASTSTAPEAENQMPEAKPTETGTEDA